MTNNSVDDRRDFYRISDTVGLIYSVCSGENAIPTENEFIAEVPDEFQLISQLSKIDLENSTLLQNIHDLSPDICRYLKTINTKIEAIARQVVSIGLTDEVKSHKVTLSAGGVSFILSEPVELGAILRTQMILYPSCSGILTYGKVVRCKAITIDDTEQYDIAIEYCLIHENDRDALVRHVLHLQSNQLRQKK
ncbi:MAG: PilZ domain-containing protein [Gammaproteobacteria bacterium]|nr:PilZ domain-containing protein [Gammaproteobacteria bacterium]